MLSLNILFTYKVLTNDAVIRVRHLLYNVTM